MSESNEKPEEKNLENERVRGIASWTKFCIENYKITILIALAFIIAGAWGLWSNQRQDFPSIPANYIIVKAVYPQGTAEDIEQNIIIPLEGTLGSIEGIKQMRSGASPSFGSIVIELEEFRELDAKVARANELINATALPADADVKADLIDISGPTVAYALTSETKTKNELVELAPRVEQYVRQSSSQIKDVTVSPESEFEIVVEIDANKANEKLITKETVLDTLSAAITTIPGGKIKTENQGEQTIAVTSTMNSITDIEKIEINGTLLKDIAAITRRPKEYNALTFTGYAKGTERISNEAVYVMITKKENGDIITLAGDVAKSVSRMHEEGVLPNDVELTEVYSTVPYIEDQIQTLVSNGVIGLVIILTTLLFVINFRAAIVVSIILPFAFLIGLFMLPALGYTLNILTLFALILTLGIIVDNAIVITEGIVHNIQRGYKKRQAAIKAVMQLGPAVTAATLTTIIVFIPFARIGGITGEFIKFIPYTIIIMLVGSYVLAITMTPALAALILRTNRPQVRLSNMKRWQKILLLPVIVRYCQEGIDRTRDIYEQFMRGALKTKMRRALIAVVALILFLVSAVGIAPTLKFEQFPSSDSSFITIQTTFEKSVSDLDKKTITSEIGERIVRIPHFKNYVIIEGQLFIVLNEPKDREDGMNIEGILEHLDRELQDVRQAHAGRVTILAQQQSEGPPESEYDLEVELKGDDTASLTNAATNLERFIEERGNVDKLTNSLKENETESIAIIPREEQFQDAGLGTLTLSMIVANTFGTKEVGKVVTRADGVSDTLTLEYSPESRNSIDDVKQILLPTATGLIPLKDVANVEFVTTQKTIERLDGERVVTVKTRLLDRGLKTELQKDVQEYLSNEKLKEFGLSSTSVQYGGAYAQNQEDSEKLVIVFLLAIILVYIVLVYQFRSYGQPFIILLTIPLALIGVFPGLKIVGSSVNMISGLGLVALIGIVVNDAIVYIDYYNRIRKEPKYTLPEALVKTGTARFKPILSTSITTIAGILPLTIRDPFWLGLGTSLVAGLIFSTIGTLIVIPVILHFFAHKGKIRTKILKWRARKNQEHESPAT